MAEELLDLNQLGERLKLVDMSIIRLIGQRKRLALQVEKKKRKDHQPISRPEVEIARLNQARTWAAKHDVDPNFAQSILYQLIGESCKVQLIQLQESEGRYPPPETEEDWLQHLRQNLLDFTAKCAPSYDEQYERAFFATKLHAEFEENLIRELAEEQRNGLALDLGCATGRHAFLLAPCFESVTGYDISPDMVRVAQKKAEERGIANASFFARDLQEGLPHEDGSVSLVVMSMGTASDMPNLPELLREIRRVLRSGGKALLSFYNEHALVYQWGFVPWTVGLAAEINMQRHCLDITWEEEGSEQVYSVFAKPYGPSDIETLLPRGIPAVTVTTHPTLASIMPDVLFEKEEVRHSVAEIDNRLAEDGEEEGAYLTVVVRKT